MKKVIIAIPSGVMVHADFMVSITALAAYSMQQGIHIMVVNKQRTRIEINRYGLVLIAQDQKADYILFLDSDMTFPPDTLVRLLNAHEASRLNLGVVACNCAKRQDPPTETVELFHPGDRTGVVPVKRIGMGVMLIHMRVFKQMKAPYFKAVWDEDTGTFTGEDYYFCKGVRKKGIKIMCDHELSKEIGHIGVRTYRLEDCEK